MHLDTNIAIHIDVSTDRHMHTDISVEVCICVYTHMCTRTYLHGDDPHF